MTPSGLCHPFVVFAVLELTMSPLHGGKKLPIYNEDLIYRILPNLSHRTNRVCVHAFLTHEDERQNFEVTKTALMRYIRLIKHTTMLLNRAKSIWF